MTSVVVGLPIGPRKVVVEVQCWSDGIVEAWWGGTALYGSGPTEAEAIAELVEHIQASWLRLADLPCGSVSGPTRILWQALQELRVLNVDR